MEVEVEASEKENSVSDKNDVSILNHLTNEDIRDADATAVLYGKPLVQKTGVAVALRDDVQRPAFMLDVRSRLIPFYEALKRDTDLHHLRAPLNAIHQCMPLALSPDIVHAFRLEAVHKPDSVFL